MLAVGGKNDPQIGQRHISAMLVDQLVDPQPAATCAFAAPHLEHSVALAEIIEGQCAYHRSSPLRPGYALAVRRAEITTVPPAMAFLTVFADALARPVARELLAAPQAPTCLGQIYALRFRLGFCHGDLPCPNYTRDRRGMNCIVLSQMLEKERGISAKR